MAATKDTIINIILKATDEATKVVRELQKTGQALSTDFTDAGKAITTAGETSKRALDSAAAAGNTLEKEGKDVGGAFTTAAHTIDQAGQAAKGAMSEAAKGAQAAGTAMAGAGKATAAELAAAAKAARDAYTAMKEGGNAPKEALTAAAKAAKEAETAMKQAGQQAKKELSEAAKAAKDLEKNTKEVADGFQTVGKTMMTAGAVIAGGLGVAIKTASDFEKAMSNVKAVSALTGEQFKSLRALAIQLGKDTQFSAGEAAQGMEAMVKAGISVENIMGGAMKGAMDMAAAGEIGLADAAEIAATALATFKMRGEDIPKVADLLAGAANASATNIGELRMALQQSALVAADMGLSFASTATTLAVFAERGLRGSDAGTSLKTMLLRLNPQTKEAAVLMKKLGLMTADGSNRFYDAAGNLKSMAEIAGIMQTATKGLTSEQRSLALETLFGTDAIRAANAMISAGTDGYARMSAEMSKVSAADVAAERMNNLAGAGEMMKSSLEGAAIIIGQVFVPMIRKAAEAITNLANWFSNLSPQTQETIAKVAAAAAAFLVVGGAAMFVVGKIPALISGIKLIATAFAGLGGPIGLAVLAITALAAAWFMNVGGIRDKTAVWFAELWPKIKGPVEQMKTGLAGIWTSVSATMTEVFQTMWPLVQETFTQIAAFVAEILPTVVELIAGAMELIKVAWQLWSTYIWPLVKVAMEGVMAVLKPALELILQAVRLVLAVMHGDWAAAWEALKGVLKAAWDFMLAIVQTALKLFLTQLQIVFGPLIDWFAGIWAGIRGGVETAWSAIAGVFSAAWSVITAGFNAWVNEQTARWDALKAAVMAVVETLVGAVILAWRALVDATRGIWEPAFAWFQQAWQAVSGVVMAVVQAVVDFVVGAWQLYAATQQAIWTAIFDWLAAGWGLLRDAVVAVAQFIWDRLVAIWTALRDEIMAIVQPFLETLKAAWNTLRDVVAGAADTLRERVTGAFQSLVSMVQPLIDKLIGWYDKAKSIVSGIASLVSKARDKLGDLADAAREAGQKALGTDGNEGGRAHGGDINKTGLYLLHKGEKVHSPMAARLAAAGSGGGRSIHFAPQFIISGAQDPEAVAAAVDRKVMAYLDSLGIA